MIQKWREILLDFFLYEHDRKGEFLFAKGQIM